MKEHESWSLLLTVPSLSQPRVYGTENARDVSYVLHHEADHWLMNDGRFVMDERIVDRRRASLKRRLRVADQCWIKSSTHILIQQPCDCHNLKIRSTLGDSHIPDESWERWRGWTRTRSHPMSCLAVTFITQEINSQRLDCWRNRSIDPSSSVWISFIHDSMAFQRLVMGLKELLL